MSSTSVSTNRSPRRMDAGEETAELPEVMRASLYQVLARMFSSPLEMEDRHPRQLREIIPEMSAALQTASLEVAENWENGLINREALSVAYARHFLGPFEILTPPYASFYLEPDQRLMGRVSMQVARFYVDAGLEPGQGTHEAPDHVALEWEFMYFMTYQFLLTGDVAWVEQRERFFSTHLTRWMPSLAAAMKKTAENSFYYSVAKFLELIVRQDSKRVKAN